MFLSHCFYLFIPLLPLPSLKINENIKINPTLVSSFFFSSQALLPNVLFSAAVPHPPPAGSQGDGTQAPQW